MRNACYASVTIFVTFSLPCCFTVVTLSIAFYDSRVFETLVRKSLSEIRDFPDYALQMMDNYFYKMLMFLIVCAV